MKDGTYRFACLAVIKNRQLLFVCLVVLAGITGAVLWGEEKFIRELRPSPLESAVPPEEPVMVQGQVYRVEQKDKSQALYLKNNSIQYQKQLFQESRMIIYVDSNLQIKMGNIVRAEGKVSYFQNARNPGNFDQKRYYQIQDIHCLVWARTCRVAESRVWKWRIRLANFRESWKTELITGLGREDGATLGAMLIGEKAEMDQELKGLYQVNGIGHILAISGLHLSFIGIGMYKMLRRLTGSYPIGGMFGILFLALYILMVGLTVSAVRALTMFLFRVGADMTGRHYDAPTALSVAAVVVLLWRPLSLYDGGFWLSFGAVFAILVVVPVLQDAFVRVSYSFQNQNADGAALSAYFEGIREHMWQGSLQGLTVSIGINLVIFPILLSYFFEFPLYSFILNLFVIPLMSVLLFLGIAGSLFVLWCEPVSSLLFLVCGKILRIYQMSCKLTLHLPGARLVVGRPDVWQIVAYYGILIIVLLLLREKERLIEHVDMQKYAVSGSDVNMQKHMAGKSDAGIQKRAARLGRFALMLGMIGIIILTNRWGERGKLTTVVLDVGQGDGIFMRGPKGGTYLVDGGSSDVKKAGQYRIEPFLKSQGVVVVDYVLISHGDSDHVNGVEELIERQDIGVRIGTLVMPVQEVWDEALKGLAEKALANGTHVAVIEPGQNIKEGNMSITCIQPGNPETEAGNGEAEGRDAEEGYEPGNAASMVLAVKFGEFDMLLTGDVEGEGEEQLTRQLEEQYRNCTWEILKVAHHGSKNSSTEEFLRQIKPVYAFISAGQENRYGHPHQETIERLADIGSKIYSTQENGAIIVEVEDGETMKVGK